MLEGLIIEIISNLFYVQVGDDIYTCTSKGKFKIKEEMPVVGDRVQIELIDENKKTGAINSIYKRNSYIKRPKIANVEQMILVISLDSPKPDYLLLDKQLSYLEFLNILPIICFNKVDLIEDKIHIEEYKKIGYKVIETVANKNIGIEDVTKNLKGKISAFSGNSGVGKSTLINAIFNKQIAQEGNISKKNQRGKNTTTSVKLYNLCEDTYIADTPGFSTFSIEEIPYRELSVYFKEFKPYLEECEFVGCSHIKEEKCGIKKALEQDKISINRYENYKKIYEELKDREEHKW